MYIFYKTGNPVYGGGSGGVHPIRIIFTFLLSVVGVNFSEAVKLSVSWWFPSNHPLCLHVHISQDFAQGGVARLSFVWPQF